MAALFARRERDGLSLRALAKETGIPTGTLSWWSWRLRQEQADEPHESTGFVELSVARPSSATGDVVVRIGDDIEVVVPPGTDADWLRDLVAAVRSC